jgi:anti-anti-sigma regulatory factor
MRRFPEDFYPVEWAGGQAVVALPEHIGISSAGQVREELLSLINRGATTLIADMTATVSCDQAGAEAVIRARTRAAASGTELRLVVTAPVVARVLSLAGRCRFTRPSRQPWPRGCQPRPARERKACPAAVPGI